MILEEVGSLVYYSLCAFIHFFYFDPSKLIIACFVYGPKQYFSLCIMAISNLLNPSQLILCLSMNNDRCQRKYTSSELLALICGLLCSL